MKKWRVRLLKTATIALVAVFLLVMSIRIQQFTVRKRAEQLEKELLALEYGKTTYDEVRPLLDRWHADFGGSNCSNVSCNATIVIGDFVYRHPALFSDRERFFNTYGLLGGQPFMIRSKISIRNNVLFYKSYGVYVEVLPRENSGGGYSLIGVVEMMDAINPRYAQRTHDGYHVGWPDGCEICVAIYVQFTPQAAAADVKRLGGINFSCLTRWLQPCRTKGDILLGAWTQAVKDYPQANPL